MSYTTTKQGSIDDLSFLSTAVVYSERGANPYGLWDFILKRKEGKVSTKEHDDILLNIAYNVCKDYTISYLHYDNFHIIYHNDETGASSEAAAAGCGFVYPCMTVDITLRCLIGEAVKQKIYSVEEGDEVYKSLSFLDKAFPSDSHIDYDNSWMIESVYVDNRFRGKGYGREMINTLYEIGRSKNVAKCMISCSVGNAVALSLYTSCGFVLIGTGDSEQCDTAINIKGYHVLQKDY